MASVLAFTGCYTTADRRGQGQGIEAFRIDQSGEWRRLSSLALINPSFLLVTPDSRLLYVAHGAQSTLSTVEIDRQSGAMRLLGTVDACGVNPVHLALTPDGRALVSANYTTGEVVVLEIAPDRTIGAPLLSLRMPGQPGPDSAQQIGPHPHQIVFDAAGRRMVIPDKGLDRLFVCEVSNARNSLSVISDIRTTPGAGPRHLVFHPTLPLAYSNNELDSSVSVYGYDATNGQLAHLQTLPTLPAGVQVNNATAEIVLAARSASLFVSNRGHDSIACFSVDPLDGRLQIVGWRSSGGACPRFMTIDQSGKRLYVANQDGNSIHEFSVGSYGSLTPLGLVVETPSPSSIVFGGSVAW